MRPETKAISVMVTGIVLTFIFLAVVISGLAGERAYPEKHYQTIWCAAHGGQAEVVLPDKTRCDCVTDTHAIEFDFGSKWAEAIGQALYYAIQTGKKAGIVLILEKESDRRYWIRLNTIINHYALPIDTWTTEE